MEEKEIAIFVAAPYLNEADLLSKAVDKIERMGYRIDVIMSISNTTTVKDAVIAFIKNVHCK